MKKLNTVSSLTSLLAILGLNLAESANATLYSVDGRSGPWLYANGGLNTVFQYGVNDHLAPTVISGLSFGQNITLTYQSGGVSGGPGFPSFDAKGNPSSPNPATSYNGAFPGSFTALPSLTFSYELVATFANSSGQIVDAPFVFGNGPVTVPVPSGATRLQLGVNDNLFGDNTGSWNIDAVVSTVPEPGVGALFAMGMVGFVSRYFGRGR